MKLHAFIFSWPGRTTSAGHIRDALLPHVEKLTVLDSSAEIGAPSPGVDWINLDPACYYGWTFKQALQRFEGDVLLQIQADAISTDWPALAARCRAVHAGNERLGVWSPEITHTDWPTPLVRLFDAGAPGLTAVALTDCTVWSMEKRVVGFLQSLDYAQNNLGWGIDVAAAGYCYANELIAVRDDHIHVRHTPGSGYSRTEAERQLQAFTRQLPPPLQRQVAILYRAIQINRQRQRREPADS